MTIPGVVRGICVSNQDPTNQGRITVRCPSLWGEDAVSGWALPCVTPHLAQPPAVGQSVWIIFEAGEEHHPVWLGVPYGPISQTAQESIASGVSLPSTVNGFTHLPTNYTPPSGKSLGKIISFALSTVGLPYVWGGTGPKGYDCSGLVQAAYAAGGISIPRTTGEQYTIGEAVPSPWTTGSMNPADLIYIAGSDGNDSVPGHVGMYIGTSVISMVTHGWVVQAPYTGTCICIDDFSEWTNIVTVRRLL